MSTIKVKKEFDRASLEAMEAEIPRDSAGNPTDDIEIATAGSGRAGATFDVQPQNTPSLGSVLATLGQDETALRTDPRALENISTAPCEASQVILSEAQEAHIQGASAVQATLDNPRAMNVAKTPLDVRRKLAEIADAAKVLPTADSVTYVDNRKVHLSGEIRDVPNQISKAQALNVIEKLVGEALTAKVVKCAMQAGFGLKPHLWLSQRLALEASKREIWDKVESINDYDESEDGKKEAVVPTALTKLFSSTVTDGLMVISKVKRISMLHTTKIMIERVCSQAVEEKAPKEYTEKYASMDGLEQLMAS